jgi:hypothetical protein
LAKTKLWNNFLDIFSVFIDEKDFKKIKDRFSTLEELKSDFYTFSFCSKKDYLPLWRYYAGNGTGIALKFRPEFFAFKEPTDRKPQAMYTEIIYEEKELTQVINKFLDLAEKKLGTFEHVNLLNISEKDSKEDGDQFSLDLFTELAAQLLPIMPTFKHHGYKDEKEHRLYYLECKTTFQGQEPNYFPFDPFPPERKGIKERKAQEGICLPHIDTKVPFVKSDKFSLDDIAEIWVGPCVHFECAKEQIVKSLSEQGYDINKIGTPEGITICKSEMPYR